MSRILAPTLRLGLMTLLAATGSLAVAGSPAEDPRRPGKESRDVTLLPNGWRISHGRVHGRPVRRRQQQRVVEAHPHRDRRPQHVREVQAHDGPRLARPRLGPGRADALHLGRRRQQRARVQVRPGRAGPGAHLRADAPHPGELRGGDLRHPGRLAALRGARARPVADGDRPRQRPRAQDRGPARGGLHVARLGRRQDALRLALGRRPGAPVRYGDHGAARRGRGG